MGETMLTAILVFVILHSIVLILLVRAFGKFIYPTITRNDGVTQYRAPSGVVVKGRRKPKINTDQKAWEAEQR